MNRVILVGRLTADAVERATPDGNMTVSFRLAVNRTYKRDGEPEADYFSCVMFGKVAERFSRLSTMKGTKLILEGEIRNNNFKDRNGIARYEQQIIVNQFEFAESKKVAESEHSKSADDEFENLEDGLNDSDLPFV